jgi:hypothetical protein
METPWCKGSLPALQRMPPRQRVPVLAQVELQAQLAI